MGKKKKKTVKAKGSSSDLLRIDLQGRLGAPYFMPFGYSVDLPDWYPSMREITEMSNEDLLSAYVKMEEWRGLYDMGELKRSLEARGWNFA